MIRTTRWGLPLCLALGATLALSACDDDGTTAENTTDTLGGDTVTADDTSVGETYTVEDTAIDVDTSTDDTSTDDTAQTDAGDTADTADMTPMCPGPTGLRPPLLSEHAGVYDPVGNRVIVHGGSTLVSMGCNIPAVSANDIQDTTWLYDVDCDVWQRIESSPPGKRVRHMMVYDSTAHRAILFGGRFRQTSSGAYTLFDDVWSLDLTTDTWTELEPTGSGPSARVNSSMVYDPTGHRVLLFGGNESTSGATYAALNDTWQLDLETLAWTQLQPVGALPTARLFAPALWDDDLGQMVIYGGADNAVFSTGSYYGDLWALRVNGDGDPTWAQLTATGDVPDDRFWAGLVYDAVNQRYVLFGGHDEANTSEQIGLRNDLDAYDPRVARWSRVTTADTFNAPITDVCMPPADFVATDLDSPERRQAHLFVAGPETAFSMGGKTDCGAVDDLAALDLATATWSELTPATQGESCERRGGTNCNALCL